MTRIPIFALYIGFIANDPAKALDRHRLWKESEVAQRIRAVEDLGGTIVWTKFSCDANYYAEFERAADAVAFKLLHPDEPAMFPEDADE